MSPINEKKLITSPVQKGIKPVSGDSRVPRPYPIELIVMTNPIMSQIPPLTWSLFKRPINVSQLYFSPKSSLPGFWV
jgi:hypothetical protein